MFAHKADRVHSLEELDEAIRDGWAGEGQLLTFIIDTNILVRAIVQDHAEEAERAKALLSANEVVIPTHAFVS